MGIYQIADEMFKSKMVNQLPNTATPLAGIAKNYHDFLKNLSDILGHKKKTSEKTDIKENYFLFSSSAERSD